MNELQVFNNSQFGELQILNYEDKAYFPAIEVASKLGYSNPRDAINKHTKENGVVFYDVIDSMGRKQSKKFISEGNLYRLITKSKLPEAEKFEVWVFDELVPQIRNKGMYITKATATEMVTNPEVLMMIAQEIAKVSNLQLDYNVRTSNELQEIKKTLTGEYVTPQDLDALKIVIKDKAEKFIGTGTQLTLDDYTLEDLYEKAQHNKRLKEQRRYDIGKAKSKILVATKKHLGMKGNAPNNHIKRRDVDRAIQFIKEIRYSEIA